MHFRKSVIVLSLIYCMFLCSSAFAAQSGDFTYTESDGGISIISYTGSGGVVVIPDNISSMPVVSIGSGAFLGCLGLTSITIPGSVTGIGHSAFAYCSGLFSVTIGNGVTSIGGMAFYQCTSLTSITIPGNVTSISRQGGWAFNRCTNLSDINVDSSNTVYSSFDGVLYNQDMKKLIAYPTGKHGGFTVPSSVTNIDEFAFEDCSALSSVTIGNGVTSIGEYAFSGCTGLTSITIPGSVTSIGEGAFGDCNSLLSMTIGNGVTSIGESAFWGCTGLTSITIPNSVASIGEGAFFGNTGLTSINVDAGNPNYSSQDGVFYNKTKTTLIQYPAGNTGGFTIPSSVTSIGNWAFSYCPGLTSIAIPGSVTSIGYDAFYGCTGLTSAYFYGNAPVMMGGDFFYGCASGFTVYYTDGSTGFTNPWCGYPTKVFIPKRCPAENALGDDNPNLDRLRIFRDNILAQSAVGRKAIQMYYNNADSINAALECSPVLQAVVRRVLEAIAPMLGKN